MNYFDQVAERQLSGAQKSKERVKKRWADKRLAKDAELAAQGALAKPSELEEKQDNAAIQMKLYRRWRAEIKEDIAKRHGTDFAALVRCIRGLRWGNVDSVVAHVQDAWWLRRADENTRYQTLRYIDDSICRARVRNGMPELDDPLPGEPDGPFQKIRFLLFGY